MIEKVSISCSNQGKEISTPAPNAATMQSNNYNLQSLSDSDDESVVEYDKNDNHNCDKEDYNRDNSTGHLDATDAKNGVDFQMDEQKEDQAKRSNNISTLVHDLFEPYDKHRKQKEKASSGKETPNKFTPKSRFKEGQWLESLAKVVAYKEENGSCRVRYGWKSDPALVRWIKRQRHEYRLKQLGKPNCMTDERMYRLESIGFEWKNHMKTASPKPKVAKHSRNVKHTKKQSNMSSHNIASHRQGRNCTLTDIHNRESPSSFESDCQTSVTPQVSDISGIPMTQSDKKLSTPDSRKMPGTSFDSIDRNFNVCSFCEKGGELLCCEYCPRAFHHACLQVNETELPDHWECPRCVEDNTLREKVFVSGDDYYDQVIMAYKSHSDDCLDGDNNFHDFCAKMIVISKILDMIQRLLEYDFGYLFSEPVNALEVPDYQDIVECPMDLGTIKVNILNGFYGKKNKTKMCSKDVGCTPMEFIILEILQDLELVWHNCLLYYHEGEINSNEHLIQFDNYILKVELFF